MSKPKSLVSQVCEWLASLRDELAKDLKTTSGVSVPPTSVYRGYPPSGGIGEEKAEKGPALFWVAPASLVKGRLHVTAEDGTTNIFLSPLLAAPVDIAVNLAHALLIAAFPWEAYPSQKDKSKILYRLPKSYRDKSEHYGVTGNPRATVASDVAMSRLRGLVNKLGACPIGALVATNEARIPQFNRLIAVCETSQNEKPNPHLRFYVARSWNRLFETRDPLIEGTSEKAVFRCPGSVSQQGVHKPCGSPIILKRTPEEVKFTAARANAPITEASAQVEERLEELHEIAQAVNA